VRTVTGRLNGVGRPDDQAAKIAANHPQLALRSEPAHEELVVDSGPGGQLSGMQWAQVAETRRRVRIAVIKQRSNEGWIGGDGDER
jgi:hypothetical protein